LTKFLRWVSHRDILAEFSGDLGAALPVKVK